MSNPKTYYRYSLAFQQKVVDEIESGKLSYSEAQRVYGIAGCGTIPAWVKKFGKNHLLNKVVRIQMKDEKDTIKELKRQKRELESALAQEHIRNIVLEGLIEAAAEHYGVDIKKNFEQGKKRGVTLLKTTACRMMGVSRQAFYKGCKVDIEKRVREQLIVKAVRTYRVRQPRVGGKKLQKMLPAQELKVGRDKLFYILRKNQLLVQPLRSYRRTTNSNHRFRKYKNLIKDKTIKRPNEVFVADITYIDTLEGFCYLALITDLYSRKIVGWDLSQSLGIEGCQKAARMALGGIKNSADLIHHSDRGLQFCSSGYVDILEKHGAKISMTEENHVYENAVAERVNGILKIEFNLGQRLKSFEVAKQLVAEAVKIYNEERLHLSLDCKTPAECYAA